MNKYCNTPKLLKEYNYINKIILDLEAEELKLSGSNKEAEEIYSELRDLSYKTDAIMIDADNSYIDDVCVKHWTEDRDFLSWHRNAGRAYNEKNKWKYIVVVRNMVQDWIDNTKEASKINKPTWMDDIIFFCKGCRKERLNFFRTFNAIINNLIDRLNSLDGGYENNLEQQAGLKGSSKHVIGFGH